MKIEGSVRGKFDELYPKFKLLEDKVGDRLKGQLKPEWHYESRTKKIESFSLKTQAGYRFTPYQFVDDFLGCLIVVTRISEVPKAEEIVRNLFRVFKRFPNSSMHTKKLPDNFQMDDVRLYAKLIVEKNLPPNDVLSRLSFEIQIKTYLQHAWSIATHDFSYKGNQISWAKDRMGAHWRAMLEHTELSIEEADKLAGSTILSLSHNEYSWLQRILNVLQEHWEDDRLPKDQKRLVRSLGQLIDWAGITPAQLDDMITKEEDMGRGASEINLSPYSAVLQGLLINHGRKLIDAIARDKEFFGRIIFPAEISIPTDLDLRKVKRRIICLH